jgi:hypothetical protein
MKKLMTAVLAVGPMVRGSASDLRQVDVRSTKVRRPNAGPMTSISVAS